MTIEINDRDVVVSFALSAAGSGTPRSLTPVGQDSEAVALLLRLEGGSTLERERRFTPRNSSAIEHRQVGVRSQFKALPQRFALYAVPWRIHGRERSAGGSSGCNEGGDRLDGTKRSVGRPCLACTLATLAGLAGGFPRRR